MVELVQCASSRHFTCPLLSFLHQQSAVRLLGYVCSAAADEGEANQSVRLPFIFVCFLFCLLFFCPLHSTRPSAVRRIRHQAVCVAPIGSVGGAEMCAIRRQQGEATRHCTALHCTRPVQRRRAGPTSSDCPVARIEGKRDTSTTRTRPLHGDWMQAESSGEQWTGGWAADR